MARTDADVRKRLRDNTKLLLVGIAALIAALAGLLALASRGSTLAPDYLTEFVLYALSATNLMMLLALVFVLVRNIVKMMVERRRGLPFARFRAKLVIVLLGMTLIPAVLVLIVGSELIRNSVDTWFNRPMEEMLTSANEIASDYYGEQQRGMSAQAQRYARTLANSDLSDESAAAVRAVLAPSIAQEAAGLAEVSRVEPAHEPRIVGVPFDVLREKVALRGQQREAGQGVVADIQRDVGRAADQRDFVARVLVPVHGQEVARRVG